jgi:hypothetical protein
MFNISIVLLGSPVVVFLPPKLFIKYLSPFPNVSEGLNLLIVITLEIELNLVPKFTLKGYVVSVVKLSGKEEDVNTASLHIAEEGPYTTLT